jgi:hypothetical protein
MGRLVREVLGGSRPQSRQRPSVLAGVEELETRVVLSTLSLKGLALRTRLRPGSTFQTASDLGMLSPGRQLMTGGVLNSTNRQSFDKFETASPVVVDGLLAGLRSKAMVQLLASNGQVLASAGPGGTESFDQSLGAGTYVVRIAGVGRHRTGFALTLSGSAAAPTGTTHTPTHPPTTSHPVTSGGTGGGTGSGTGGGGGGGGGTVGGNPTPDPTQTSEIPSQGVYNIAIAGTTYTGDTDFLYSFTNFTPYANFYLGGTLVVAPTQDPWAVTGNGVNDRDIAINTGNIGVGGPGVMEFATNTILHQLFGGGFGQGAALDVAYVSTNEQAGTINVQIDTNVSADSQLNTMFWNGGLLALPTPIVAGQMQLQFSNGGQHVDGSLTFFSGGYIEPGTAMIQASFSGDLA